MYILYDFDDEQYEYDVEFGYKQMDRILKDYTKADLLNLVYELLDMDKVAEYLEGDDIVQLDRQQLLEVVEDLVDYDDFKDYFIDELKDMYYARAYKEYKDCCNYWE